MAHSGSNKKVANSLVALSSAAVMAVYSAGYVRTRSAADRFALHAAERRPTARVPQPSAAAPVAELRTPVVSEPSPTASPASPAASGRKREVAAAVTPNVTATPSAPAVPLLIEAPPPEIQAAVPIIEHKVEIPIPAPPAPPAPPKVVWKDGTYLGWGYCRHGEIQASVVIEGGRITSATIAQCQTRYSCSIIDALPPQVAQRQSVDVDSVSGATQSADAFSDAVFDALTKAK